MEKPRVIAAGWGRGHRSSPPGLAVPPWQGSGHPRQLGPANALLISIELLLMTRQVPGGSWKPAENWGAPPSLDGAKGGSREDEGVEPAPWGVEHDARPVYPSPGAPGMEVFAWQQTGGCPNTLLPPPPRALYPFQCNCPPHDLPPSCPQPSLGRGLGVPGGGEEGRVTLPDRTRRGLHCIQPAAGPQGPALPQGHWLPLAEPRL